MEPEIQLVSISACFRGRSPIRRQSTSIDTRRSGPKLVFRGEHRIDREAIDDPVHRFSIAFEIAPEIASVNSRLGQMNRIPDRNGPDTAARIGRDDRMLDDRSVRPSQFPDADNPVAFICGDGVQDDTRCQIERPPVIRLPAEDSAAEVSSGSAVACDEIVNDVIA